MNTSGWATYADAASAAPTDGTGGSPNITLSRSVTNPIRGTASFLMAKDAANRQGQGISYDFTIDRADASSMLTISFDWESDIALSEGDLVVWIYDKDNGALIQPTPYKLPSAAIGIQNHWSAQFQTSALPANDYRLIIHIAVTSASAWNIKLDNFAVGPTPMKQGVPITDWQNFTPTGTWSTNTAYTGAWRRVGQNIEIKYNVALSGAPNVTTLLLNLPAGIVFNGGGLSGPVGSPGYWLGGYGYISQNTGDRYSLAAEISQASQCVRLYHQGVPITQASPITFANGDVIRVEISIPVVGWSSNCQVSSDAETRVVEFSARDGSGGSHTLNNGFQKYPNNFSSVAKDTHGAWDAVNTRYVIPVPGFYVIYWQCAFDPNADGQRIVSIKKNGSTLQYGIRAAGNAVVSTSSNVMYVTECNAGDYIEFYAFQNSGGNLAYSTNILDNACAIFRISGPSQIAASEKIAAMYCTDAGQTVVNGASTVVNFEDKTYDTHGAVTVGASWKFTAPRGDYYLVAFAVQITAGTAFNENERVIGYVTKNGVTTMMTGVVRYHATTTVSTYTEVHGSIILWLNAGEYVDLRINQNCGSDLTLNASATNNWICVASAG